MYKLIRTCILLCLLFLGGGTCGYAQDAHLSQFWMSPLRQNPALAGIDYGLEAFVNYKNQWGSVSSPYKTFDASFDMRLNKKKITRGFFAAGLDILSDKAGEGQMGTLQAGLSLAYHVILDQHNTLGAGLMGGFGQRSVSYSNLSWASQFNGISYNPALPGGETSSIGNYSFMDLGAGIAWAYHRSSQHVTGYDLPGTNAGLAFFHPQQPGYAFASSSGAKLYMKIVGTLNCRLDFNNGDKSIIPGISYTKQGTQKELLLGAMLRFRMRKESMVTGYVPGAAFSIGASYRNNDAVIVAMLLEIGQMGIGFSYDINVSPLKTASTGLGGAEISIRFRSAKSVLMGSKSELFSR
jgi:type IX secretion system PorP/SprF family membrane protein